MNELKIMEWNTHCSQSIEEVAQTIVAQKADIVVITELSTDYEGLIGNIRKTNPEYQWAEVNKDNANGIAMLVSNRIIVEAEAYSVEQYRELKHPDFLPMRITLADGRKLTVVGLRFQNYSPGRNRLSLEDATNQLLCYFRMIGEYQPDVLIGDFNWDSAIHDDHTKVLEHLIYDSNNGERRSDIFDSIMEDIQRLAIPYKKRGQTQFPFIADEEDRLCEIMSSVGKNKEEGKKYGMLPTDRSREKWSKVTKGLENKILGISAPDRVIYDQSGMISGCEYDYYPYIDLETDFPKEWTQQLSDHALMNVTLTLK